MDELNITKAHFIGYSLGGSVALYLAIKIPHRIATITTIGQSGFADPTGADEFEPEWLINNQRTDTMTD